MPRKISHRRAHGLGTIEQLKSGRFRAKYTDHTGRRKSAPTTFPTRAQAESWLLKRAAAAQHGEILLTGNSAATLEEYAQLYLDQAINRLKPRTVDGYRHSLTKWILPPLKSSQGATIHLAPLPLNQITPGLVRTWYSAMLEKITSTTGQPAANSSAAAAAYRTLRQVCAQAVEDELLATNPVHIRGAATATCAQRQPLTPTEVTQLAARMPDRLSAAVHVGAWSGLRPGELFALQVGDIELETGSIYVRRTLVERPGHALSYGTPKSQAGLRKVTLPATAAQHLRRHLEKYCLTGSPHQLVFRTETNHPYTATLRSRAISQARAEIGRPDMTWHHLRHTGATLAAIAGATQAELQARIGHSTARAAAIYQHVIEGRDAALAEKLDAYASGAQQLDTPRHLRAVS